MYAHFLLVYSDKSVEIAKTLLILVLLCFKTFLSFEYRLQSQGIFI